MIAFHSSNYNSFEEANTQGALYKTGSDLEESYTNLADYEEIIEAFARCLGVESGEYVIYWIKNGESIKFKEKLNNLCIEEGW